MPIRDASERPRPLSSLQAFVGWSTLIPTLCLVLFFGGNSAIYWVPLAFLALVLFVVQVVIVGVRGSHASSQHLIVPATLVICVLAWGVIQTIPGVPDAWAHPFWDLAPSELPTISAAPNKSSQTVLLLAACAMIFWIAVEASQNGQRALWFLGAFSIFSTGLAAFGISAAALGQNAILGNQATSVVSATFVNRNSYALFASFGMISNLGLYLHLLHRSRSASRRTALRDAVERFLSGAWVFLLGAIICLSALLLTASRAGLVAGLLGAGIMVILTRRGERSAPAVWLSTALIFAVVVVGFSDNVVARFLQTNDDWRFVAYREIVANLGDRLYLGHGFGTFEESFRPLVPFSVASKNWSFAHNTFLENVWEMGLPAALAFYCALLWVAIFIFRGAVRRRRNRVYSVIAFACIVAGGLHSLVDFSLQMPATGATFAYILGIGWAHAWPGTQQRDEAPNME